MITFAGGNFEIKLQLVRDSFSSRGVERKKYGRINNYIDYACYSR